MKTPCEGNLRDEMGAVVAVRPLADEDKPWLRDVLVRLTAGPSMVSRGRLHDGLALPGVVAEVDGERAGVVLYRIDGDQCELVFVGSTIEGAGAASALIEAVRARAKAAGCARMWVITTNDNTPAIRFYQRRGFVLAALHRDALAASRVLKPTIPQTGVDGIPLRDELEFEWLLS